jgi:hypothetical protein
MIWTDLEYPTEQQQKYGFYVLVWEYKKRNMHLNSKQIAQDLDTRWHDVIGALRAYANFHCKDPWHGKCSCRPRTCKL